MIIKLYLDTLLRNALLMDIKDLFIIMVRKQIYACLINPFMIIEGRKERATKRNCRVKVSIQNIECFQMQSYLDALHLYN